MAEYVTEFDWDNVDIDGNPMFLTRECVVRCRDCRRSFEERGELWCRGIVGPPVEPDGFCAWGQPREEE